MLIQYHISIYLIYLLVYIQLQLMNHFYKLMNYIIYIIFVGIDSNYITNILSCYFLLTLHIHIYKESIIFFLQVIYFLLLLLHIHFVDNLTINKDFLNLMVGLQLIHMSKDESHYYLHEYPMLFYFINSILFLYKNHI